MSLLKELNEIPAGKRDLRTFGLTMCVILGALAGLLFWRQKEHWIVFTYASAAFLLPALVWPASLKIVHRAWMSLAVCMGWVMSRVILTLIYYLAVTPIAFFMRLSGKDNLALKPGASRGSYWTEHRKRGPAEYEKQY